MARGVLVNVIVCAVFAQTLAQNSKTGPADGLSEGTPERISAASATSDRWLTRVGST
jgi:hypothetical protein